MRFYIKKKILVFFAYLFSFSILEVLTLVIKMNSVEAISIITAIVICNKLLIVSLFMSLIVYHLSRTTFHSISM